MNVPLLKDNELVGQFAIYRQEVRPFTDKQIAVLQNFAAQAVIAIENTRLLNELRQSLEQQTATADVLRVISSSPGELEPVFNAMLENATRICEAKFGVLQLCEDGGFRMVAMHNAPPAYAEARRREPVMHPSPLAPPARVAATKRLLHIPDMAEEQVYKEGDPSATRFVEMAGVRTLLVVPMLKEQELIGEISVYRQEVRPFTDKQIELVQNFAAQAVIAIENTRLLDELRQSLEQQTATADVLRVISSSPGELEPVFEAMLANAVRICNARFGNLLLFDGRDMRMAAMHNAPHAYEEARRGDPVVPMNSIIGPLVTTKKVVHIDDLAADQRYANSMLAKVAGARTALAVPMLRDNELVGAIAIYHQDVHPFTDKQVDLVSNFAAQAVIAIENTRLLNELRQRTDDLSEALDQQTATSEVLGVISSSPGELEPVFQSMLENAVRICDAKFGVLFRYDNEFFDPAAMFGVPPTHAEHLLQRGRFQTEAGSSLDRLVRTREVIRIADEAARPNPGGAAKFGGARSFVAVPMLNENRLIGAIIIYRQEVRPFTDKQVDLVQNFAAQAVIAIENTRLLSELRQSLEQQTATADVLRVISSSPGDLQPVFDAMLENATRICEAKFGNLFLRDGGTFRAVAVSGELGYSEFWRRDPVISWVDDPDIPLARLCRSKSVVHLHDLKAEQTYRDGNARLVALVETAGARTFVAVPMLKDGEIVGAIAMYRQEVRPFTDKQIALVQNFAAQAVIAIENTRLLNELRNRCSSNRHRRRAARYHPVRQVELKPVFETMLDNATRHLRSQFRPMVLI